MLDFGFCEKVGLFGQIRADQKQVRENHRPLLPIPVDNVRGRLAEPKPIDVSGDSKTGEQDVQMDPPEAEKPEPDKSVCLGFEDHGVVWILILWVENFMDDIQDEFFANLSQATIDTAIEVWFFGF